MTAFSPWNQFRRQKTLWLAFFVIFTPLFVFAYRFTVPAEDAVILYEYAKNLALRGIITYGGSIAPIEGATDFAWMVTIALLKYVGLDEFASTLLLNFLGLIFIASQFKSNQHKLLLAAAALLTPYLYASLNGFSAIFFSALYILIIKHLIERNKNLYLGLLILCLVRPDGIVWGAGCVIIRLLESENKTSLKEELKTCFVLLIAPGLIYFLWRFWYFKELFPLPFIVKSTSTRDFFIFYKDSIYSVSMVVAPVIFTLIAFTKTKRDVVYFLTLFGLPLIFYSVMRLEQNIGNRFMAPLFFACFFLISYKYGQRALVLFVLLSFAAQMKGVIGTAANIANSSRETVFYLSKDLSNFQGRMLITEAGRLTYYSSWFSEDSWGLNTPRYAHKLISKSDITEGRYDLIVGHCDISMLNGVSNLNHDQSRTWDNQCKTIVSYVREGDFEIYLLPFINNDPSVNDRLMSMLGQKTFVTKKQQVCKRHDIYAVSRQYSKSEALIETLKKYDARKYSYMLTTLGDEVCD
jgi:hypothetical protein